MTKRKFPRSVLRYIRTEKARIRKTVPELDQRAREIAALYERFVSLKKERV